MQNLIINSSTVIFLLLLFHQVALAQTDPVNSVFVTQEANTGFTVLNWPEPLDIEFSIKRKALEEEEWTVIDSSFSDTQFVDTGSELGKAYEYQISSFGPEIGYDNLLQYANVYAGHEIPSPIYRGRLLLLVENDIADALSEKIERWKEDVIGDGWAVEQINLSEDTPMKEIRGIVMDEYHQEEGLEALFLLGRIAIPINAVLGSPDGHSDHNYWAADAYYGGLSTTWKAGGYFDFQLDTIAEYGSTYKEMELQIGRLDFHDMPAFTESEIELYQQYFDKNHAFRNKHFTPKMQAVIQENFNDGYDLNARRDFAILLGTDSIQYEGYRDSLLNDSYIWSFGAGSGNYTGAAGISNTSQMTTDSLQGVFTMLFGSYFGDWRTSNNFLRSSLGSGSILTSCWGARPNWSFFHMGLGTNIGAQTKLSHNDDGIYSISISAANNPDGSMDTLLVGSSYAQMPHITLLGDPTLRMNTVHPVSNVNVEYTDAGVIIDWQEPSVLTDILRYNIYRKYESDLAFVKIGSTAVGTPNFLDDNIPTLGEIEYLVKAEKLEETLSGSYYNESTGKGTSISASMLNELVDSDNDGFPIGEDCDDTNSQVNSSTIEIPYNGIDDDCNPATLDDDLDNDGYVLAEDCDDQNNQIYPGAQEIENNGVDENCNGSDELNPECPTFTGTVDEAYLQMALTSGCDSISNSYHPFLVYPNQAFSSAFPFTNTGFRIDICDGYKPTKWPMSISVYQYSDYSNAPNGPVGELIATTEGCSLDFIFEPNPPFYTSSLIVIRDATSCSEIINNVGNGIFSISCIPKDMDGDGYDFNEDCDDTNAAINPNQSEIAYNGIDDDCNPQTLDDDLDQDGFLLADDCNDENAEINPNQSELTYNGIDDDCNPQTLDDDLDEDGFLLADDCNDDNATINPDAEEIPDNDIDEDCDGELSMTSTHEIGNSIINIYPNPVSERLNISGANNLNFEINLFNEAGQLVLKQKNITDISMKEFQNGTYLLKLVDLNSKQFVVTKIIVAK